MFQIGDVIRSKKTGKFYTVTEVVNAAYFNHNESTKPKFTGDFEKVSMTWGDYSPCIQGQVHKWVDVGFRFTKTVCFYCNKEREPSQGVGYGH